MILLFSLCLAVLLKPSEKTDIGTIHHLHTSYHPVRFTLPTAPFLLVTLPRTTMVGSTPHRTTHPTMINLPRLYGCGAAWYGIHFIMYLIWIQKEIFNIIRCFVLITVCANNLLKIYFGFIRELLC